MSNLLEKKKLGKQNPWWDDDGDGIGYEEGEVSGKFKRKKKVKEAKEVKRWWDDDGDGIGYEPGEVSGKFKKKKKKIKESFSNWREDLIEVVGRDENPKQIKEKKVKNNVKTSAIGRGIEIGEEFGETGGVILEVNEVEEVEDIFSELNEHEIAFLNDHFIENVVEEFLYDCIDEGYKVSEVVNTLIDNINLNQDILSEARVTYGHDTEVKSDRLNKVKSAAKSIGKKLIRGAGYAAGAAVRGAKAAKREFSSGYERGRRGSNNSTSTSSNRESGSERRSSGPGLLSRIGSKLKSGLKSAIAKGARSVSRGARNIARRMEGETSNNTPSPVHSRAGTREPAPYRSGSDSNSTEDPAPHRSGSDSSSTRDTAKKKRQSDIARRGVRTRGRSQYKVRRQLSDLLSSEEFSNEGMQLLEDCMILLEREMTAIDKAKENKLKKKFDDSQMKQNMIDQYGKEKGTQIYFAKIRKMAMEDYELDEAKLSRTEKREKSAGKKKGSSKTMHLVDLDANAMKPKKKGVEAKIGVQSGGKTTKELDPQQFNHYKFKDDEKPDFSQFRSSKIFKKTLKGNKHVRNLHRGGEASGLTARGAMDNNREVKSHVKASGFNKKHGVNFKGVHFTGDVPGKGTDDKKMKVIKNLIKAKKPKTIKFSDDHAKNLSAPENFNKKEGKDKTKNRGSSTPKIKTYLTRSDGRPKRFGSGGGGIRDPRAVNKPSSPQENQRRRAKARRGMSEDTSMPINAPTDQKQKKEQLKLAFLKQKELEQHKKMLRSPQR